MYERERERERERAREREREGGGNSRAVDSQLFCSCFYSFLSFFSLRYVQYTYSGFITKLTSSAVTRIEMSSGGRKSLIWKNVLFRKRCYKISSEKMTLCNKGFLIH